MLHTRGITVNTFDETTHTYSINGRVVPSFTQVAGDLLPCWHASEWHLKRGRAVHAAAAMVARCQAFECDPQIAGQVAACREFFRLYKPVVLAVERPLFSHLYQFGGMPDLVTQPEIVDYKARLTRSLPYQLAAYSILWHGTTGWWINRGFGVELREDGTFRMSEFFDLRKYRQRFLAMLTTYNVRLECGATNNKQEDAG